MHEAMIGDGWLVDSGDPSQSDTLADKQEQLWAFCYTTYRVMDNSYYLLRSEPMAASGEPSQVDDLWHNKLKMRMWVVSE